MNTETPHRKWGTNTSCVREHDAAELCAVVASVREIAVKVLGCEAGTGNAV